MEDWDIDDMQLESGNDNTEEWQTDLDNKFISATIEMKNNENLAIKLFLECIELETTHTHVINLRFQSLTQILLLRSRNTMNNTAENKEIIQYFEQLLQYYPISNSLYISTNDFNDTIRLLFNSMKVYQNFKILLECATVAQLYFTHMLNKIDSEYRKKNIQFTLQLIKDKYIDKFDIEYTPNIIECDQYQLYNAINDTNHKIVVGFTSYPQFHTLHPHGAIHLNIANILDDKYILDTLRKYTKVRQSPKIYFYFETNTESKTDEDNDTDLDTKQILVKIQKMMWQNTMMIVPIYFYGFALQTFCKYYPFLCDDGTKDKQIYNNDIYPNQIIDNKLFLGNMEQVTNDTVMKNLQITHIVNCTPIEYDNEITKHKERYIQFTANDNYYEEIDQYFESAFAFIDDAICQEGFKVMVHCQAGISRSATIVMSYLMRKNKWSLAEAFKFVKSKRSKINPNEGFMKQLQKFDALLKEK